MRCRLSGNEDSRRTGAGSWARSVEEERSGRNAGAFRVSSIWLQGQPSAFRVEWRGRGVSQKVFMKTRRLLYVDDSMELARLIKTYFEMRFPVYEVLLASSVEEALQKLRAWRESGELPRAVVADVHMHTRNDGVTLVEAVRAEFPKMRTVLVSGAPRHAREVPAHPFVLKDGNAIELVDRIFDLVQCPTDELPCLT